MSFAEFNPVFKKMNLKPKGEVEIILTTSLSDLRGSVETLSEMIDQKIRIAAESTVITYNVQINARTEQPIKTYRVDENGVVSEFDQEGDQLEMELGVHKEDPIEDVPEEIGRDVVDDFIMSGLAPRPEKHWYPVAEWVARLAAGETYLRLANEAGISGGCMVDLIDEYRQYVAPLAAKWDEWRKNRIPPSPAAEQVDMQDSVDGDIDMDDGEGVGQPPEDGGAGQDVVAGDEDAATLGRDEVEIAILTGKAPDVGEVKYDFADLLRRKRTGESWISIAGSLGVSSGALSATFADYKKRVAKAMGISLEKDDGAA